jgi:hypothetical protein
MTEQAVSGALTIDERLTEPELTALVATLDAECTRLRGMIDDYSAISAKAQHRLIGLQLADAERE